MDAALHDGRSQMMVAANMLRSTKSCPSANHVSSKPTKQLPCAFTRTSSRRAQFITLQLERFTSQAISILFVYVSVRPPPYFS